MNEFILHSLHKLNSRPFSNFDLRNKISLLLRSTIKFWPLSERDEQKVRFVNIPDFYPFKKICFSKVLAAFLNREFLNPKIVLPRNIIALLFLRRFFSRVFHFQLTVLGESFWIPRMACDYFLKNPRFLSIPKAIALDFTWFLSNLRDSDQPSLNLLLFSAIFKYGRKIIQPKQAFFYFYLPIEWDMRSWV